MRFNPDNYCFFGVSEFGRNKTAAKELAQFLQERAQVEQRDFAANGYDLPPLISMSDFEIWSEVEPPKATVYNYPMRPWHDAHENITAISGATGHRGADVFARYSPDDDGQGVFWPIQQRSHRVGKNELEGFMREALLMPPVRRCPDRRAVP